MDRPHPLAHPFVVAVLVTLLTGLAYLRAPDSPFQYDDQQAVLEAVPFLNREGLTKNWAHFPPQRPLTQTSLAFDAWRSGMGPEAAGDFHVTNLLLHLVAAGLLYRLALRLFQGMSQGGVAAALAALVFSLHPLQAQAADYVINRSSILAAIGTLAALRALLKARDGHPAWFLAAALAWGLGLAGKQTAAAAPLLGLLCLAVVRRQAPSPKDRRLMLGLLGALVLEAGLYAGVVAGTWKGPLPALAFARTQLWVVPNYARLVLFPWPQSVVHDMADLTTWTDPRVPWTVLAWGLAIPAGVWAFRRAPWLAVAAGWGILALLPEASVLPLDERMMEHRTYLAMGGAALGAGWLLSRRGGRTVGVLLALLVLATLGRGAAWAEPRELWREACRVSPRAQKAWINLGQADAARLADARRWTLRALRIRPGDTEAVMNLGALDADAGNAAEAERLWRALPDHPQALFGLGNLCQESGRLAEAEAAYRRAIDLSQRRNLKALNALGTLLAERKDAEGARTLLEEALSRKPDYFEARLNLGMVLLDLGQFEAGQQALEAARGLEPGDPGVNLALGGLYKGWGNALWASRPSAEDPEASLAACATLAEAKQRLAPVLQMNPSDPTVLKARDLLDQTDGYWRKALEAYRCVVSFPEPRRRLRGRSPFAALAYEQMGEIATLRGDLPEGLELLRRALALDPGNKRIQAFLEAHPVPAPPPPGKVFMPGDLPAAP